MGRIKKNVYPGIRTKKFRKRLGAYAGTILAAGLTITAGIAILDYTFVRSREKKDFVFAANEITQEVIFRLEAHALMLRAGVSYFVMSDTVTRNDWKEYIAHARIDRYLPNVQGIGYAKIIPADLLEQHVQEVRREGFPHYRIYPSHKRTFYSSIVFVEPFTGRNLRAFGYDMFTEQVRKKAMEFSRDLNKVTLSSRIQLEIDTGGEKLFGCIMFAPVYAPGFPVNTVEQRQEAIRGWLYSPYRLKTFMQGIYDYKSQNNTIRLKIYDEEVSESSIMFDSQGIGAKETSGYGNMQLLLPVFFNKNTWYLQFTQPKNFPFRALISFIAGSVISLLLYLLALVFSEIEYRSQQLRTKNKELKTLNATKDKFFSIIAHDLKSPFNAVLGFSDVLLSQVDKMDRNEIARMIQLIRRSANLAVELQRNLMVWAQSQTGKIDYFPEKLDIVELINEVVLLFVDLAGQKEIKIIKKLPVQLSGYADREMLKTILRNLISNAIKFTNNGGKVTISAEKIDKELHFSVSDNGVGISSENRQKLFHIDKSYSTSGTNKEEGTGLGLILCKEFVDKHKGRIWVESKTGSSSESGSSFMFTIPDNPAAE